MGFVSRLLCAAYAVILSYLLLSPNPLGDAPRPSIERGPHTMLFVPLAVLVLAARLPLKTYTVLVILLLYAAGTEIAQALVPNRHADPLDLVENLLGVAIGSAIVWAAARAMRSASREPAFPAGGARLDGAESKP